jgi:hypothetical protein
MNEETNSTPQQAAVPGSPLLAQTTPPSQAPDAAQTGQAAAVQPPQGQEQAEQPIANAEPPGQHTAPDLDGAAKTAAGTITSEDPSQSDPPRRFAYWEGQTLPRIFCGLALQTECLPGTTEVKVRKVVVSDGDCCLLVKPSQLKQFLIQHSAWSMPVFFDGQQANAVLCRLFATCKGMTAQMMLQVGRHLWDVSSVLTAVHLPPSLDKDSPPLPNPGFPPPLNLDTLIKFVIGRIPEGNPYRQRLIRYYEAAQRNARNTHLRLAVTAMATSMASDLVFDTLRESCDAVVQAGKYANTVFFDAKQAIGCRIVQRQRALEARQRWLGHCAFRRVARSGRRRSRRSHYSDDY